MAEGFEPVWAVGLMTGTVLDGNIDVALLKTDGERIEAFGAYTLAPYPQSTRDLLEETLQQARAWNFEGDEPAIFAEAEEVLTRAQAYAVRELVESHGLTMADIGAVGFHGQTVLHRAPQEGRLGETRQLGDGDLMHSILGCPVVYDFRSADMRAGGQGAPLSAAYHAALLRDVDTDGETAVLNPYLTAPYPKSLDRFDFGASMADGLDASTGAATLTAFTASAVGKALDLLPVRPNRLIVCGGGRHNPTIMKMLGERAGVPSRPSASLSLRCACCAICRSASRRRRARPSRCAAGRLPAKFLCETRAAASGERCGCARSGNSQAVRIPHSPDGYTPSRRWD